MKVHLAHLVPALAELSAAEKAWPNSRRRMDLDLSMRAGVAVTSSQSVPTTRSSNEGADGSGTPA